MEKSVISKAELRKWVLEKRKHLDEKEKKEWDKSLFRRIKELLPEPPGTVYCYAGVRGEAETEAVIDWYLQKGICVALPRVERPGAGNEMRFFYIKTRGDLVPGAFGIPEPDVSCRPARCPDAPVLVPGVAFSRDLSRLGYGGGFYDRFFAREPQHEKIGLCYGFQMVDAMESGAYDVRMDQVVTPEGVFRKSGINA